MPQLDSNACGNGVLQNGIGAQTRSSDPTFTVALFEDPVWGHTRS